MMIRGWVSAKFIDVLTLAGLTSLTVAVAHWFDFEGL